MNENISLETLETLMKKHGAVIRAVPEEVTIYLKNDMQTIMTAKSGIWMSLKGKCLL